MIAIPPFHKCLSNINTFVSDLTANPTNILFLYFTSKGPIVKTKFGKWQVGEHTFYVIPGNNKNYVYAYLETGLKGLIDVGKSGTPSPFNANFVASASVDTEFPVEVLGPTTLPYPNSVNIGNHIDFSVHSFTRNKQIVTVIQTHLTNYDILYNGTAERNAEAIVNFTLDIIPDNAFDSLDTFSEIHHDYKGNINEATLKSVYGKDKGVIQAIYNLSCITLGIEAKSGGNQIKQYHKYRGKRYLVREGTKGGKYILVNKKKIYIKKQTGGTLLPSNFDNMIYETFVKPVSEAAHGFMGAEVFFDIDNELTNFPKESSITIIYDFDEHVFDIFQIDAKIVLNALKNEESSKRQLVAIAGAFQRAMRKRHGSWKVSQGSI